MNAIIASALLGVLMMFASWIFDNEKTHTRIALVGLLALIVANVLQLSGIYTIPVDYKGLLAFQVAQWLDEVGEATVALI